MKRQGRGDGNEDDARATKKPSGASDPALSLLGNRIEDSLIASFRARGFVVLPSLLSPAELTALRDECNLLFESIDSDRVTAVDKVIEQGCVLDVMATCPMDESAQARVDQKAYLQTRARQLGGSDSTPRQQTIETLVFHRLPTLAAQLLHTDDSNASTNDRHVYFFNEHYVAKPPDTAVEFRWHRDDDEQLAMCVHRDSIPPYLSAWIALDDVTDDMGPLRFVSLSDEVEDDEVDKLERLASAPLCVHAGSVVWFWSNVWHCSSANASSTMRRAFYAQYSSTRITAKASEDDDPLSFAIPCAEAVSRK